MNEKADALKNRSIEIVKWLSNHLEIQRILCREGYDAELEEYLKIIEILENQGMYELIYILLVKNQYQMVIEDIMEKLLFETLTNEWEKVGNQQMCHNIKERIKAEIQLK